MLQRRGRLTYRTLKRQFDLDNDFIADLKIEKLYAQLVTDDLTAADRRKGENP